MAYTIKINTSDVALAMSVRGLVLEALATSRFTADVDRAPTSTYRGSHEGSRKNGLAFKLARIRLRQPKSYCGQHPGECLANGGRKMKATYLEWDDWVELNDLINAALDDARVDADVWSKPHDVAGIFWIRKGLKARKRYEWQEKVLAHPWGSRPVREWNRGTEDQFS